MTALNDERNMFLTLIIKYVTIDLKFIPTILFRKNI